ncbi:MAG TPA: polysaccharide biosynthesis/export family protein [Bauldia sp.]|nr:polysaccharide biosynthesis/export family protein [Bauldia sp.]
MRLASLFPVLLGLAALAGCADAPSVPDAVHTQLVAPYQLDSGDQLRIIVFGQDDLSNTYEVDQAGRITMPLIGAVEARGHTTTDIAAAVATRLRNGYLRSPDVTVEVDKYRPFFAMGEVGAAGQYAFVPGMTVQQAIAVAGGFTPRADEYSVQVTRSYNGQVQTAWLRLTDPVMPGDTLYVRQRLI